MVLAHLDAFGLKALTELSNFQGSSRGPLEKALEKRPKLPDLPAGPHPHQVLLLQPGGISSSCSCTFSSCVSSSSATCHCSVDRGWFEGSWLRGRALPRDPC